MTEEEKKTIEKFKKFINFGGDGLLGYQISGYETISKKELDIILNLIEKLKKENEGYKTYIKKLDELDTRDFILKDNVRELIKELKQNYFEEDGYCWNGFRFQENPSKVLNIKEDIETEDLLNKLEQLLEEE